MGFFSRKKKETGTSKVGSMGPKKAVQSQAQKDHLRRKKNLVGEIAAMQSEIQEIERNSRDPKMHEYWGPFKASDVPRLKKNVQTMKSQLEDLRRQG